MGHIENPKKKKKFTKADAESPEGRNYITYLYRDLGYTDQQVADELGITRRTIYNWRNSSRIIDQAISLGKSYADTLVENSLLQQAMKGNVTAIIFWLRNRKPNKWNNRDLVERQKIEAELDMINADLAIKTGEAGEDLVKAQSEAIADMINSPTSERILEDFMGGNKDDDDNSDES